MNIKYINDGLQAEPLLQRRFTSQARRYKAATLNWTLLRPCCKKTLELPKPTSVLCHVSLSLLTPPRRIAPLITVLSRFLIIHTRNAPVHPFPLSVPANTQGDRAALPSCLPRSPANWVLNQKRDESSPREMRYVFPIRFQRPCNTRARRPTRKPHTCKPNTLCSFVHHVSTSHVSTTF